jgi:uncharacterized protein (TIGR03435 family)
MRAEWRNVLASGMFELGSRLGDRVELLLAPRRKFLGRASLVRVALSTAVMMGMATSGSLAPRWIAYAQAGVAFEVSPAIASSAGPASAPNIVRVSRTPEKIAFQATLVGDIMAFAYGFPLDRVERPPQWMYDDRYDVAVITAAPTTLPDQKLMIQKLLEEKFGLAVHRVSNPSPVYFLVRGSKVNLTETTEVDAVNIPEFRIGLSMPPLPPGTSLPWGRVYAARHVSMSDLTAWLYSWVRLPVLDKTGIVGLFDIEIPGMPVRGSAEGAISAVRNALGLDLELHQGTAELLIIDRVEKPPQTIH